MSKPSPEMEKMYADVERRKVERANTLKFSNDVLADLGETTTDFNLKTMFLGNMAAKLDEKFGVGSTLGLDWMVDHYLAFEFERNVYPWVGEIYNMLKAKKHHYQNKREYFNDSEAYYIPHKEKQICVFGSWYSDRPTYLVIDDKSEYHHKFYVRQIWPRLKANSWSVEQPTLAYYRKYDFKLGFADDSISYGDCRDVGHIFTYEHMGLLNDDDGHGKCDHAMWTLQESIRWFFEVNTLHTQLKEDDEAE